MIVDVIEYFRQIFYGIISDGCVNFFVYSSFVNRQKLNSNFGTLSYEVINSPLLLMNFYLDVLARIVFNFCDKLIFPAILPNSTNYCRNSITHTLLLVLT